MSKNCFECGGGNFEVDCGTTICVDCGTVLEESSIAAEVSFQDGAGGSRSLVGKFLTAEQAKSKNFSSSSTGIRQESREVTHLKGKRLILQVGSQLRISQRLCDTAFNFFKIAVSRNCTRGRPRSHVVAACLYMTCRLDNSPHLLLDFSDVIEVNIFDLGRTLNFLSRTLNIKLPMTEPCLYVLRFAANLEFGEKEKEVVTLATRLVQRMKRDWIALGRRPTGLCGAALLLAGRCYNFNRTVNDIVRVVHVSETVVRRRLYEFGKTPSSELTVEEFSNVDLEKAEDPPAFVESRRKAREIKMFREEKRLKEMEKKIVPVEEQIEEALEKKRKEKFKRMMRDALGDDESKEISEAQKLVCDEIYDDALKEVGVNEIPTVGISSVYAPSLQSLGILNPSKPQPTVDVEFTSNDLSNDGELDLTGIDDEEIDSYILAKEEVKSKEKVWMSLNGAYMIEMEQRKRLKAEEAEREKENPTKKRRLRPRKEPIIASTFQEAVSAVMKEKRLFSKLNYDILKDTNIEKEGAESNSKTEITKSECAPSTSNLDEPGQLAASASSKTMFSSTFGTKNRNILRRRPVIKNKSKFILTNDLIPPIEAIEKIDKKGNYSCDSSLETQSTTSSTKGEKLLTVTGSKLPESSWKETKVRANEIKVEQSSRLLPSTSSASTFSSHSPISFGSLRSTSLLKRGKRFKIQPNIGLRTVPLNRNDKGMEGSRCSDTGEKRVSNESMVTEDHNNLNKETTPLNEGSSGLSRESSDITKNVSKDEHEVRLNSNASIGISADEFIEEGRSPAENTLKRSKMDKEGTSLPSSRSVATLEKVKKMPSVKRLRSRLVMKPNITNKATSLNEKKS